MRSGPKDPIEAQSEGGLRVLPLVTLYLTDRCNSRCVSCDYWRHGRTSMSLGALSRWLPGFAEFGTRVVMFSGGEPLLHPDWSSMAELLRSRGLKVWLLSSGLALNKHARRVSELFDSVTVSLDGAGRASYAAIRGVDAFDTVCEGIRSLAALDLPAGLRVTVQRANYRELPRIVALAQALGARNVSFLAADVSNPHAFGRELADGVARDIALRPDDLPAFERVLDTMEHELAPAFESRFIAESPLKLRRILQYFRAVCGMGEYPSTRCNAPEFSAVIEADERLRPCFFIPGPPGAMAGSDLPRAVNDAAMVGLRTAIREGHRMECARCVCSMWRDPDSFADDGVQRP